MIEYKVKVYEDGSTFWHLNGKLHREDGPAVEYSNGSKFWWLNGQRHREDGPAGEYADGGKFWWLNGQRHREDGPAVEYSNGSKEWWLNDDELTEQEFNNRTKTKELTIQDQQEMDDFITRLYKGLWKSIPRHLMPLPSDVERRNNA